MPRTFNLLRTLGRGAHGTVHLAELRDDDDYVQTLAIKRLLPEWSGDQDLVARLKDEAKMLAFLHHDHVVRVHGLTRIDGALAILMEPVEGQDLAKIAAKAGRLAPKVALGIVEAVSDALDAAWCTVPPGKERPLAVVHRDIKPSNVMLTPRGGVKVMDFGVARAVFDAREGETRSQQFGTARYMAPERWLHGSAVHESDVFSLGITLLELVSGEDVPRLRLSPEAFAEDINAALSLVDWEPLRTLAAKMTAFRVEDRLTAAAVAVECRALIPLAPGPSLREWASENVSKEIGETVDPTCTVTVMQEDTAGRSGSSASRPHSAPPPPSLSQPPSVQPATPAPSPSRALPWLAALLVAIVSLSVLRSLLSGPEGQVPPENTDPNTLASQYPPDPVLPLPVAIDPDTSPVEPAPKSPASSALVAPSPEPVAQVAPVYEPPKPKPAEQLKPEQPKPEPVGEPEPVEPAPERRLVPVNFKLEGVRSIRVPAAGKRLNKNTYLLLPADSTVEIEVDEPSVGVWRCTIAVGDSTVNVNIRARASGGCTHW